MRIELNRQWARAGVVLSASLLVVAISAVGQSKTDKQSGAGKGKTGLEVISVDMKVMRSTDYIAFVSWKVVVKNHSSRGIRLLGTVSFLDSEGYTVDSEEFEGDIDAGEQKTFTEEITLEPDDLKKVTDIKAKVREI